MKNLVVEGFTTALRHIANTSIEAIVILEEASVANAFPRILYANPAFGRLSGFDPNAVVGKTADLLWSAKTRSGLLDKLRTAGQEERPVRVRLTAWRHDGGDYVAEVTFDPVVGAEGDATRWIAIHRLVVAPQSDRRAAAGARGAVRMLAEDARDLVGLLGEALDLVSVGFCLYSRDRRLLLCNRRQRAFFAPVSDLLVPGARAEDIIRACVERDVIMAAQGCGEAWIRDWLTRFDVPHGPIELQLRDGCWLRNEMHRTDDGGIVTVWTDITDLKEKEDALRQRVVELQDTEERLKAQGERLSELAEGLAMARDEAERANRTKSEFLANMSHELRSPLNAIIGFAEIMKDELFGPLGFSQYREYAEDIYNSGAHLLEVINDILDLSKIEAGKLALDEETVDLTPAIEACMRLMGSRAQEAKVLLEADTAADLPPLFVDERKIKQVLINLLSNAVKFTPEGGHVRITAQLDDAGRFVLTVADTGIGMALENIETAMSSFGQVDSSLARRYEGTGLGLPLTKALVTLHGGRFELTSEVGAGTRATVILPARRVIKAGKDRVAAQA